MGNRSAWLELRRGGIAMLALGAAVGGCTPSRSSSVTSARMAARASESETRSLPVVSASAAVQALPAYKEAKIACGKGQYREAADILAGMQKSAALTSDQREFCHRQERICLASLSPPKAASSSHVQTLPAAVSSSVDCGPRALLIACRTLGIKTTLADLTRAAGMGKTGASLAGLKRAAESLKLKAEGVQVSREALPDVPTPSIGWTNRDHYVVISGFSGRGEHGTATIQDPNENAPRTVSQEKLLQATGGYLLTLRR